VPAEFSPDSGGNPRAMSDDESKTDFDELDVERDDDEGPEEPQPWAKLGSGDADEV
jgi:hypothetical protein